MVSTAAFYARVRGSFPGLSDLKETKMFLPHSRVKVSIVGSLRDWEVACSASDQQGSNFESCVWRTVSSQSSHHPQEVLLAQFILYVHKGGLKPDSFHFNLFSGAYFFGHPHLFAKITIMVGECFNQFWHKHLFSRPYECSFCNLWPLTLWPTSLIWFCSPIYSSFLEHMCFSGIMTLV